MIIFQGIIIILALACIMYLYAKDKKEKAWRLQAEQDLELAKQKLAEARGDFSHIKEDIFKMIDEQFGPQYVEDITNGVVTVGMPPAFLAMAWGHPQRIERSEDRAGEESWYYKEQDMAGAPQTQVIIQNQKVIKLKDF